MRRPWPTGGFCGMGGGEDVFYTKLLDVIPDYKAIMFKICRSSIVLIQL
jgi:hypothetical protein